MKESNRIVLGLIFTAVFTAVIVSCHAWLLNNVTPN